LETVIEAAGLLQAFGSPVQFVLCGDGSKTADLKRRAAGLQNVLFLGWVDVTMLQAVASVSAIGLCAYAPDALQSLPNKPFEYMASRLAIVSSLRGELADVLNHNDCGLTYSAGDATSLAQCMHALLNDSNRLRVTQDNAYRLWNQQYRSTEIYTRFADHLAALAQSPAVAA
jgi:glycosyltransferase involved in cell wall biosynthesis